MNYETMTDEQLVELFQQGDEFAFTTLFGRYQAAMKINAGKASDKYPFSMEDFFGYFQERFFIIAKKFDFRGTIYFRTFCTFMFPRFTTEYVRDRLRTRTRDEEGVLHRTDKPSNLAISIANEKLTANDKLGEIYTSSATVDSVTNADKMLLDHLRSKNENFPKIVSLLAYGYSYAEIATKLGHEGNIQSRKDWMSKQVKKIRSETIRFYAMSSSLDEIQSYIS